MGETIARTPAAATSALLALVLCLAWTANGSAQSDPKPSALRPEAVAPSSSKLEWKWRRAPVLEYVAAGAAGAGAFMTFYLLKARPTPHRDSGILFDDGARKALRLRSPGARDTVRALSDVTGITTLVVALALDSIALPLLRGGLGTIAEVLLMDVEALALTSLATSITFDLTGRARPSYDDCKRDPSFDPLCYGGSTTSFFSGHTSQAFMAAGLSCAHHQYLKLYGDAVWDAVSCAGSLTLASTTGVLRILGDRHYASDVIVGALVGFAFGYGIPVLLHYSMPLNDATVRISPAAQGIGVNVSGGF